MKHLLPILILLAACTVTPIAQDETSQPKPKPQPSQTLDKLPKELTIDYFKTMRLEGADLELVTVLDDNEDFTRYEIRYTSNGLKISGILNIPKGEGPMPLIILNHGYIDPSVYTVGRGLKREQDYLARHGFAVLHTDYRGHGASDPSPDTKEIYDAGLEYTMDSINAINAVRNSALPELAVIDVDHVGMLGHSLGGGVTLNVLVSHPDMVDAAVLYAPVSGDAYKNFDRWRRERPEGDNTLLAFGEYADEPSHWDALSSINYLQNIDDPVFLFHGTSDDDVPVEWSYELRSKMIDAGKTFGMTVYTDEEHEFVKQFDSFMQQTVQFFTTFLTPNPNVIDPSRVTKKPFGMFVEEKRFTGYHVGTDFEVRSKEDPHTLTVQAICNGTVLYKSTVSGYGGVLVQSCTYNEQTITVLYGHLWLDSISLNVGDTVERGAFIGNLGEGFSAETDGERPHLHLGISRGEAVELRGYTLDASEVEKQWIDPEEVLL